MRYNDNFDKMKNSSRVAINTTIVYAQLIINTIIGLFFTRIILQALGEEDYGIYMLVGGVVTMLNILNSSMSNTAMRYMGHSLGAGDLETSLKTFNTTMYIHFILGGIMILVLEIGGWIMFEYFLNIPEAKVFSAKIVYQFMIVTTFISIISVPFDAVINAHENLLFLSATHVLEYVLKLLLAIFLLYSSGNLLILYGLFNMIILILMRFIKQKYSVRHYDECRLKIRNYRDKQLTRSILSFTGWELFASAAAICQGQLRSVLMNMFFGVKLNAAEGIGSRVNTQVNMVSIGITKAITPQMNKNEGAGNREKMLYLAGMGIKYTTFMFALIAIPLMIEAEFILDVWLDTVPAYAVIFSQFCLAAQMLDKFTWQIGNAIRAAGRIKEYQITSGLLPIVGIVISYFVFKAGYGPISIYIVNLITLSALAIVRLWFGKRLLGLSPVEFIKTTTIPVLVPLLIAFGLSFAIHHYLVIGWMRLLWVFVSYMIVFSLLFYIFGVNKNERGILKNMFKPFLKKISFRKG